MGKRSFSLLDVTVKNADLVCRMFGPDERQKHVPSGHPVVEMALAKLYKVMENEEYLRTAKYFVEEMGQCTDGHTPSEYSQDHKPILEQDEITGRADELYGLFPRPHAHLGEYRAQAVPYGGIGSRAQDEGFGPDYELHNHTAYCETCAAIANVFWNHRMFLSTGDARYVA